MNNITLQFIINNSNIDLCNVFCLTKTKIYISINSTYNRNAVVSEHKIIFNTGQWFSVFYFIHTQYKDSYYTYDKFIIDKLIFLPSISLSMK